MCVFTEKFSAIHSDEANHTCGYSIEQSFYIKLNSEMKKRKHTEKINNTQPATTMAMAMATTCIERKKERKKNVIKLDETKKKHKPMLVNCTYSIDTFQLNKGFPFYMHILVKWQ